MNSTLVREWRRDNRPDWGHGPWTDEPDKVQWVDEETGLDCLAVRHPKRGHWCGYVGVAEGHPWFGKHYNEVRLADVEEWPSVHGGLTFSDLCREGDESEAICHVPFAGRPDKVWWLGFDCAHCDDIQPIYPKRWTERSQYRDLQYIKSECADLARQAAQK